MCWNEILCVVANDWNCKRLDVSFNNHRESFFDLPVHSKNILEDFLIKNLHIIKDFTVSITEYFTSM